MKGEMGSARFAALSIFLRRLYNTEYTSHIVDNCRRYE